jgi:hypothetical protein
MPLKSDHVGEKIGARNGDVFADDGATGRWPLGRDQSQYSTM